MNCSKASTKHSWSESDDIFTVLEGCFVDNLCEFVNILQRDVLEGCFVDSLCEFVNILQRMFSEVCFVDSLWEFVAYKRVETPYLLFLVVVGYAFAGR